MLKNINEKNINEVWHKKYFEICKLRMSETSYKKMIEEINIIIDEKLKSNSKLIVRKIFPKKAWKNTIWEEAYTKACSQDDCYSGQFVGLLVCQELIARGETWYFIKSDVASNMVYFNKCA